MLLQFSAGPSLGSSTGGSTSVPSVSTPQFDQFNNGSTTSTVPLGPNVTQGNYTVMDTAPKDFALNDTSAAGCNTFAADLQYVGSKCFEDAECSMYPGDEIGEQCLEKITNLQEEQSPTLVSQF